MVDENPKRQETCQELQQDLLNRIEEALAANPVIDEKQIAAIDQLRRDIRELCGNAKTEEAERATGICLNIIRQDEPAKE